MFADESQNQLLTPAYDNATCRDNFLASNCRHNYCVCPLAVRYDYDKYSSQDCFKT